MRCIFLDLDGVLVPYQSQDLKARPARAKFDAVCALNELVRDTGAVVVLTSSWRIGNHISALTGVLRKWGAHFSLYGKTQNFGNRGREIMSYITARPQIESVAILDDERAELLSLEKYLVTTDSVRGFGRAEAARAKLLLEAKWR